ncbi:hypothetical protein AOQ88_01530 [Candidatus Riesia sp. GBBU]|nr:hypothetical protein AOQ88_01530 [Candidatus Riesia sp. GBBU]
MYNLKNYNSFKIKAKTREIRTAYSSNELINFYKESRKKLYPVIILGEGNNTLFLRDFNGTVILNKIKILKIKNSRNKWIIHVGSGNNWHKLVVKLLKKKIYGLENMAFIPGSVGAAPIHNIGAYGVEFKDFCEYVDIINLENGEKSRLYKTECKFNYRTSIFQSKLKNFAIISVGLKIKKKWRPILTNYEIRSSAKETHKAIDIAHIVHKIRKKKIPNPIFFGNFGSFFKNPIIPDILAKKIKKEYPLCPILYHGKNKFKIYAAWLIEKCNLKGYKYGGVSVYKNHASILINVGNATSNDLLYISLYIYREVLKKFKISLEPEVSIIGKNGKINSKKIFNKKISYF